MLPTEGHSSIDVTLAPLGDTLEALEAEWRELETRADASFFTSWTWLGSWLRSLASTRNMLVLRARRGPQTLALASFGHDSLWRRGFVNSHALFLNEAGYDGQDVLTIEYNGILVAREHRAPSDQAIAAYLLRQRQRWNEIYLHGTTTAPTLFDGSTGVAMRSWTKAAPQVRLDKVRLRSGDYLGLLKQKPRYEVRRSKRLYEALGPLTISVATNLAEARACLAELITLHTPHWNKRGGGGAFSKPFERQFHDRLVEAGLARGEIQLLTVRAGPRTVGCLYNFVHRGHVCVYQTGFDYALLDATDHPGLVTHAMAIELNAALGHEVYDFMAGDHLYKRKLSTDVEQLHWSVVQRQTWALRFENGLRRLKQTYLRREDSSTR